MKYRRHFFTHDNLDEYFQAAAILYKSREIGIRRHFREVEREGHFKVD